MTYTKEVEFNKIEKNSQLIDCRSKNLYKESHILNAINIPFYLFLSNFSSYEIKKTSPVYIYCSSGKKSKIVTSILNKKGFDAYSIIGGYKNIISYNKDK